MAQNSTVSENHASGYALQINGQVNGNITIPGSSDKDHCLRYLSDFDPREDKARLEHEKGRVLEDCYNWIIESDEYLQWKNTDESSVLWVRGGPGKGKTMMSLAFAGKSPLDLQPIQSVEPQFRETKRRKMCQVQEGIYSTQPRSNPNRALIAYFFCQHAYPNRNSASSVLSGLVHLLAIYNDAIMKHVKRRYNETGKKLFEEFFKLQTLIQEIYSIGALDEIYYIIDALDECDKQFHELLNIIRNSNIEKGLTIKWFITSRENIVDEVEMELKHRVHNFKVIQLDSQNLKSAVSTFIRFKVQRLGDAKKYDEDLQEKIQEKLREKAGETFLWVALVCKNLERVRLSRNVFNVLERFPRGLEPLYDRMMKQIARNYMENEEEDGDDEQLGELCKELLRSITVAYRPLNLVELFSVSELPVDILEDMQSLENIALQCGDFLQLERGVVSFIHLSAREYFVSGNGQEIFDTTSVIQKHDQILHRSLDIMSKSLKMDISNLKRPAATIPPSLKNEEKIRQLDYACSYWIHHALESQIGSSVFSENGEIHQFLKKHLLHWFEVLSILGILHDAIPKIARLQHATQNNNNNHDFDKLSAYLADALRLLLRNATMITSYPLQAYSAALAFAPHSSLVRQQIVGAQSGSNTHRISSPQWIRRWPEGKSEWSNKLQTIQTQDYPLHHLQYSPNGELLAAASKNRIRVWDGITGIGLQTLKHESIYIINSFTFSADGRSIMFLSNNGCIQVWDVWNTSEVVPPRHIFSIYNTAESLIHENCQTCQSRQDGKGVDAVFSPDGRWLAVGINNDVEIWDICNGQPYWQDVPIENTVEPFIYSIYVAFSWDGRYLASISMGDCALFVALWDVARKTQLHVLKGYSNLVCDIAFSQDSKYLAMLSSVRSEGVISIWDVETGIEVCEWIRKGDDLDETPIIIFSPDGKVLSSCQHNFSLWIWKDVDEQTIVREFKISDYSFDPWWGKLLAFSPDGKRLAVGCSDGAISLYDPYWEPARTKCNTGNESSLSHKSEWNHIEQFRWSPDYKRLVSKSDGTWKVYDTGSRGVLSLFDDRKDYIDEVAFSPNGRTLALSDSQLVEFWDISNGMDRMRLLMRFKPDRSSCAHITNMKFSHDGRMLWYIGVGSVPWQQDRKYSIFCLDISSGEEIDFRIYGLIQSSILKFDVSRNNEYLAYSTHHHESLVVRDIRTHQDVMQCKLLGKLMSLAFYQDHKKPVVVAGREVANRREYAFLEPQTGNILRTLELPFGDCMGNCEFSEDGSYMETRMGIVSIPSSSSSCVIAGGPRDFMVRRTRAHDSIYWLTYGNTRIIPIPADDPVNCVAVHHGTVILGHYSGLISWFEFDLKLLEKMFPDSEYQPGVWN